MAGSKRSVLAALPTHGRSWLSLLGIFLTSDVIYGTNMSQDVSSGAQTGT
jgi:hypothetical protein